MKTNKITWTKVSQSTRVATHGEYTYILTRQADAGHGGRYNLQVVNPNLSCFSLNLTEKVIELVFGEDLTSFVEKSL